MQPDHFSAIDPGVVEQLLPLGDSLITAGLTLVTALITYSVGRSRAKAEVANLEAEKKSIEAATGVKTADAARVISEAAVGVVAPLMERLKEQREEMTKLIERNVELREENELMRTHAAKLAAENELMKRRFKLQGEVPPEITGR